MQLKWGVLTMKTQNWKTKILWLILGVVFACMTSCSAAEDRLVGQWQYNSPDSSDSIHFSIAKGKASKNGFYFGFSYTNNGQAYYPEHWSIIERKDGSSSLLLASTVDDAGFAQNIGSHRIVELTQDTLSLEWGSQAKVVQFHRAK